MVKSSTIGYCATCKRIIEDFYFSCERVRIAEFKDCGEGRGMQAHEIMKYHVIKVKEYDLVSFVIEKFIEYGISGLPVVNDRNEMVGYISDGDIMRYIGKHEDMVLGAFFFTQLFKGDFEAFEDRANQIMDLNVMEIAEKSVYKVDWDEEIENIAAIREKTNKKITGREKWSIGGHY